MGVSFMNMASNYQEDSAEGGDQLSGDSGSDFSDTDTDSEASTDSDSDTEDTPQSPNQRNVCKYYNRGQCRYGEKCRDEHVCSNFLNNSCKYGTGCRLNHNRQSPSSGQDRQKRTRHSPAVAEDEEFEGPYRWQLNTGKGWKNISNDHILEAQYSLPNTKGIKIYNTSAGAVSIDFIKMRVLKKTNIKVRRMSSKDTEWLWYYRGNHCWYRYGDKGKSRPIQSSKLETEFQKDRNGSVKLTIDSTQYEICFKGMRQRNVSTGHKRTIRRRPKYEPPNSGGLHALSSRMKNMMTPSTNKTPEWQFHGRDHWHTFKNTGGCSVSSADIERCFKKNQTTMNFTVNEDNYTLDFGRMRQINQRTKAERKVRRV
ncbi:protein mono-ADP-ribosyltransferase PARP12 [Danio aesculapii]|uniref:protein mono-ADP-ribosyltransferase PARP12 n=1 Tax=Danio aesculapii TaxID=1142201 RepID=UPI0024BF40E6|nr:protein mono-ADP-ribosyltransferase PARP12 [Danio aesculapii]